MHDQELYQHLLGLRSPWQVSEVKLDIEGQQVDVWAGHDAGVTFGCPECGRELGVYDHSEERSWRHLDSCQFKTYLHARPPRVKCPEHGVKQAKLPWAEAKSRFTALFERLAIDVLKETDVAGATRILRISWDEAWSVMARAVRRGQVRKEAKVTPRIGVDEKSAKKGHRYLTLVCDLDGGTVEYLAEERKQESLDGYFKGLTEEQRTGIEAVAMDMWEPYIQSVCKHLPQGEDKIVFDRYHVMKHVNEAVNHVRKQEHRTFRAEGDDTLTGSKYLWLYAAENLPEKHQDRFEELMQAQLKTGRAWAIKETLRDLWAYSRRGWAERFFKKWYFWATHSKLAPMVKAARTIKRHIHNILTYFAHPVTNALTEGLNAKIQTIKKMAHGYRNMDNFKTAIYFHCGGLDLYPATHGNPG